MTKEERNAAGDAGDEGRVEEDREDERPTGERPTDERPTDEREAMRRFEEEIGRLTVADHVLLMMQSLSSLAVERLGATPETASRKDLEQVRLAVDAFKALLGTLEGRRSADEIHAHRSVLSQLQMAYVAALEPSRAGEGGDRS